MVIAAAVVVGVYGLLVSFVLAAAGVASRADDQMEAAIAGGRDA